MRPSVGLLHWSMMITCCVKLLSLNENETSSLLKGVPLFSFFTETTRLTFCSIVAGRDGDLHTYPSAPAHVVHRL